MIKAFMILAVIATANLLIAFLLEGMAGFAESKPRAIYTFTSGIAAIGFVFATLITVIAKAHF